MVDRVLNRPVGYANVILSFKNVTENLVSNVSFSV